MGPRGVERSVDEQSREQTKQDALSELIEVERRIEQEVKAAQIEAARIIEAARRDAESRAEEVDASIASALESLRLSIENQCETSIRSIEADAQAELERYREIDSEALRRLARWLVARVAGGGERPTSS
jgi:vacuolar-type H+-ATPase subunit H